MSNVPGLQTMWLSIRSEALRGFENPILASARRRLEDLPAWETSYPFAAPTEPSVTHDTTFRFERDQADPMFWRVSCGDVVLETGFGDPADAATSPGYGEVMDAMRVLRQRGLAVAAADIPGLWNVTGHPELTTNQVKALAFGTPA